PKRHRRPAVALVKRGNDKHCYKSQRGDGLNYLLALLLLGGRTGVDPSLEKPRIPLHEVDSDSECRPQKYRKEHPSLPVAERPGGYEQQRCHGCKEPQKPDQCFLVNSRHNSNRLI